MNVRWLTTRAAFFLLTLTIYSGSTLPKARYGETLQSPARLRFGQSIALSDFDADGLVDVARLDTSGSHKNVAILLSASRKLSFLHFDSRGVGNGTLLAQDVDNDGAPDLVWTDLLREDSVVVWLSDGSGDFEQVTACAYGGPFTLGGTNIAAPGELNHETAINFETKRPLDQMLVQACVDRTATRLPNQPSDRIATSTPVLEQPADRGPPPLLS